MQAKVQELLDFQHQVIYFNAFRLSFWFNTKNEHFNFVLIYLSCIHSILIVKKTRLTGLPQSNELKYKKILDEENIQIIFL